MLRLLFFGNVDVKALPFFVCLFVVVVVLFCLFVVVVVLFFVCLFLFLFLFFFLGGGGGEWGGGYFGFLILGRVGPLSLSFIDFSVQISLYRLQAVTLQVQSSVF